MNLSVVIPSKTRANVKACLHVVRSCEPPAWRIVIDDGIDPPLVHPSCDGLYEIAIPGVKPFVYARNCNRGIRAAGQSDVVLLNDDALLQTPGGFSLLQRAAEEHPEFGLISATTNLAGNSQQQPQGIGLREADRVVAFVCVFIPRRTFDLVGLLDERFTAYGWEDNDYCRRVRAAGLKLGVHDGCFVNHGSLRSTFRGDPRAAGDIGPGAEIYRAKWGDLA